MSLKEKKIEKLYYSIGKVAEMFNVNTSLIRFEIRHAPVFIIVFIFTRFLFPLCILPTSIHNLLFQYRYWQTQPQLFWKERLSYLPHHQDLYKLILWINMLWSG